MSSHNLNSCLFSTIITKSIRPTRTILKQLFSRRLQTCSQQQQQQQQQVPPTNQNNNNDQEQQPEHFWSILKQIYRRQPKTQALRNYAALLLNINDKSFNSFARYKFIWDEASFRVAVDGSANCLAKRKLIHSVNVVCGDFDSIDPELVQHLRCPDEAKKLYSPTPDRDFKMPQVIETPNQKETDFTKALRVAATIRPHINTFICFYNFDGSRLDHLFAILNTLYLVKKPIFIVNVATNTVSWLLPPGKNVIHKVPGSELCSLIPFTGAAEVKTLGLEYEINNTQPLSFGSMISTSNLCNRELDSIVVETNRELLWSIDLQQVNQ